MTDDPVVADVRAQRAQLLEAAGGTLENLIDLLRRREHEARRIPIILSPPTVAPTRPG
jgi:hypothetical protein